MTGKLYKIFLDDNIIGTTQFERADAPMGVVVGHIDFMDIASGYEFFKQYCSKNNIKFSDCYEDRVIMTMNIPNLKVFGDDGNEIKGQACSVCGADDVFEITLEGIPYPFYANEFIDHAAAYNKSINSTPFTVK